MKQFLTKSPDVALVEIKEILYERMKKRNELLDVIPSDDWDHGYDRGIKDELKFLSELLDLIERS